MAREMTRLFLRAFIVACILVNPALLQCQSTNGTILGNIKDPSGAVVAGAQVSATNTRTNIKKTTQTDKNGNFQFPDLLPGTYDIEVQAAGFKTWIVTNISLNARSIFRADASLHVGSVENAIEVPASAAPITTDTGTVAEQLASKEIQDLPINFRGTFTGGSYWLVADLPGVQVSPGSGYTIAGSHQSMNEISVDGFSITNNRYNNPTAELLPSAETLSEIKVTSEGENAEYGQVADISFISHGGTNQYHGSLFEYLQNNSFDATPLFAIKTPPKHANDFGGSLGGPLRFPGYNGKDSTFFFFDWESNRFHSSNVIVQGVPTVPMRSGDFSSLCSTYNSNGICTDPNGKQLTNPFTGQPYPNNVLPSVNSVSQAVLNTFYPLPNFNSGDITSNYRTVLPLPVTSNQFDIRLDRTLTSKQSLWGRFSWRNNNIT